MSTSYKYAVFILSHLSPDNCKTLDTLLKCNYSGKYYIVVDDEDKYLPQYKSKYKEHLVIFNKAYYMLNSDTGLKPGDNVGCALYARNAVEDIASYLGLDAFLVMDDDVLNFKFRIINHEEQTLKTAAINSIDAVFNNYIETIINSNITCGFFGTQNFYMGGYKLIVNGYMIERRVGSNVFIRNASKPCKWSMSMFEDFSTCILYGSRGDIFITLPQVECVMAPQFTQLKNKNKTDGNVELYTKLSDFKRGLFPLTALPSCCTAKMYRGKFIPYMDRNTAYPKIISNKFRSK